MILGNIDIANTAENIVQIQSRDVDTLKEKIIIWEQINDNLFDFHSVRSSKSLSTSKH
jgi:hypothetical protein